jgi:hypothetical protein
VRVLASPLAGEAAVRGAGDLGGAGVIADPALHLAGAPALPSRRVCDQRI